MTTTDGDPFQEVRRWRGFGRAASHYAALPVSLVVLAAAALTRERVLVLAALLAVVLAAAWFAEVRAKTADHWLRVLAALAASGLVIGAGFLARKNAPAITDLLWFVGGSFAILALALLISKVRMTLAADVSPGTKDLGRIWTGIRPILGHLLIGLAVVLLGLACINTSLLVPSGVAGLLTGIAGVELASETMRHSKLAGHRRTMVLVGALLIATCFGILVAAGADPLHALLVVAVVLLGVWMATSVSVSLAVVVAMALALSWATSTVSSQPDPAITPRPDEPYFVALGDSYMSGEGASSYYEGTNTVVDDDLRTNECRQAPTAWAPRLAADHPGLKIPDRVMFLACSGAVADNLSTRLPGARGQVAQLAWYRQQRDDASLEQEPEFVVLGMGGNDAGFSDIGRVCVGPGDCSEVGQKMLDRLRKVGPELAAGYANVKEVFGDIPVIVVGYPVPVTTGANPCNGTLLGQHERQFVAGFVRQLNNVVEERATTAGFLYVDTVESAMRNRLLCGDGTLASGINFVAFNPKEGDLLTSINPTTWTHNSLHPTADGHEAIRQAVADWLATRERADGTLDLETIDRSARPEPPTYDAGRLPVGSDRLSFAQCRPSDSAACDFDSGFTLASTVDLLRTMLLPLLLLCVGCWLFVAPFTWWSRDRDLTVLTAVRRAVSPTIPPPPPPGGAGGAPPGGPALAPPATVGSEDLAVHSILQRIGARATEIRKCAVRDDDSAMLLASIQAPGCSVGADLDAIDQLLATTEDLRPWYGDTVEHLRSIWARVTATVGDGRAAIAHGARERLIEDLDDATLLIGETTIPHRVSLFLAGIAVGDRLSFEEYFGGEVPDPARRKKVLQGLATSSGLVDGYVDVEAGTITKINTSAARWAMSLVAALLLAAASGAALIGLNRWADAPGLPAVMKNRLSNADVLGNLAIVWLGMLLHVLVSWYRGQTGANAPARTSIRRTLYLIMSEEQAVYVAVVVGAVLAYAFALTSHLDGGVAMLAIGYSADSIMATIVPRFDENMRKAADTITAKPPASSA